MFTLAGETIGVVTTIESGVQNDESTSDFGTMMRFYSGSGGLLRAFVVPTNVVNGVIGQARVRAVTVAEERARKKAADTTKKAGDKAKPTEGKKP